MSLSLSDTVHQTFSPELVGVLHDGSIATTTGLFPGSASGYDEPVWDAWRSSSTSTSPTKGVVAADRTTTCMIVGNEYTSIHMTPNSGTVVCWPETSKYEAIFPPTESYLTVAVAESTCLEEGACSKEDWIQSYTPVCAIRASDGRIVCCCGSPDFMATIPTGSFTDIAISSLHGCGLLKEGGIVCWGDETKGKIFAPNIPNGSGGAGPSGIVIQPDGEVLSEDDTDFTEAAQTTAQQEGGEDVYFVEMAVSDTNSCGVLLQGKTFCWGNSNDMELEIAAPTCLVDSVSTNGYVSCVRLVGETSVQPQSPEERRAHDDAVVAAIADAAANGTAIGISPGTRGPLYRDQHLVIAGPSTGVFCWQSFPDEFVGLERVTETWEIASRKVPLDVRPPLDTLAVCMGLPDRESNYDRTRGEALAIAIVICAALAFTAYRMLILKRFGDFSWGVTVARHRLFWFGYFMGLLDLITQALFVILDIGYISFRAMYLEAEKPYGPVLLGNIVVLIYSFLAYLATSWRYVHDEFGKVYIHSPVYIAKRRFFISLWCLISIDVPQCVFQGIYYVTMTTASLKPSPTAILSTLTATIFPLIFVSKNYFRAKKAQREAVGATMSKGTAGNKLSDLGALPSMRSRNSIVPQQPNPHASPVSKLSNTRSQQHQRRGNSRKAQAAAARAAHNASQGHDAAPVNGSVIAAFAAKQTQAKLHQIARTASQRTSSKGQMARKTIA